jgi:RNA polymerase sigma-70 factor (ECF subfamily)
MKTHLRGVVPAPGSSTNPAPDLETDLEGLWDRHGGSTYALACALLGDEASARRAVRLAMADLARSSGDLAPGAARRSLARHVHRHAQDLDSRPSTAELPPVMTWLSRLARLQRESLALCVYGGLTHREAADLLGVTPGRVADLLTGSLRELARFAAAHTGPASVPAQSVRA